MNERGLMINTSRTGYGPDQISNTMTVGEMIEALREYDEDMKVFLKNDNGYTYGGIDYADLEEEVYEGEDWDDDRESE